MPEALLLVLMAALGAAVILVLGLLLFRAAGDRSALAPPMPAAYRDDATGAPHLALVHGELSPQLESLVRVHQPVSILDLLENQVTTHSWTMASALEAIKAAERGVVVLLNCEESADQMFAQFEALAAPRQERSPSRSARMDLRTYGIGAQILKDLGVGKMTLLASPRKMPSMTGFNLEVMGFRACPEN